MKGFIEVTDLNGRSRLVNTAHISEVSDKVIYMDFVESVSGMQNLICCQQTYDEIKKLIQEAIA